MPFRVRNPYYLRISQYIVLPIYLYLDERHLDWMSDLVLQHVLEDLRPNILTKLREEAESLGASAKKSTVDVYRGDSYQFCYFLRKTQPHSFILKERNYVAAPPRHNPPVSRPKPSRSKRKSSNANTSARKRRKQLSKEKEKAAIDDVIDLSSSEEEVEHNNRHPKGTRIDIDDDDDEFIPDQDDTPIDLDIEEEEEKPKPKLELKYRGFKIYVAPTHIRMSATPVPGVLSRAPSVVPTSANQRAQTPLFLPDDYDRGETPFPFTQVPSTERVLPPVPLFEDAIIMQDDWMQDGSMMEFSQVLNTGNSFRAGAIDDDDDMDGHVMFGDADEVKEL